MFPDFYWRFKDGFWCYQLGIMYTGPWVGKELNHKLVLNMLNLRYISPRPVHILLFSFPHIWPTFYQFLLHLWISLNFSLPCKHVLHDRSPRPLPVPLRCLKTSPAVCFGLLVFIKSWDICVNIYVIFLPCSFLAS